MRPDRRRRYGFLARMKSALMDVAGVSFSRAEIGSRAAPPPSELAAYPSASTAPAAIASEPTPRMLVAVGALTVVAVVAALYLARAFFVPLLLGILASYALRPLVDWLKLCRVPRPVAAALVLALLTGTFSWVAFSVSDDVAAMVETLPQAARKLRQTLSDARERGPTALQNMQEAANELQGAAADAGAKPGVHAAAARGTESSAWLRDYALSQSALLFSVVGQAPIVLLLAYFLLASGTHFRRKLLGLIGPSLSRKRDAVQILGEIDVQVQRYLLATFVSNIMVAAATWLAFQALGMEHAAAWGVAAGVLHFVPYLGPALIAFGSGVAGFLQFDSLLRGLAVGGASLVVTVAVGMVFTTWLQSRFASVNAAVLFIALLFFGWLWGVWGLLLGAPLLVIAQGHLRSRRVAQTDRRIAQPLASVLQT
jgi:predicted PurR-regulated permease PerM